MMSRSEALQILATDHRFSLMTAGEALLSLTQAFKVALEPKDMAFFEFHAEEPCHEVARACRADHVWHGDENSEQRQKPRWQQLGKEVLREVISKT